MTLASRAFERLHGGAGNSLVLGEEDDFEDTTRMYYCVFLSRERERERERDFFRVVDNNKCVISKSDDDKYIRATPTRMRLENGGKNTAPFCVYCITRVEYLGFYDTLKKQLMYEGVSDNSISNLLFPIVSFLSSSSRALLLLRFSVRKRPCW